MRSNTRPGIKIIFTIVTGPVFSYSSFQGMKLHNQAGVRPSHETRFFNHCSAESPVDIFSFLCNAPLLRFYIKNAAVAVVVVARLIIIPGPRMLHMLLTRCVCGPWLATWSYLGTAWPEGLRIFYSVPVNIEKGLFSISRVP